MRSSRSAAPPCGPLARSPDSSGRSRWAATRQNALAEHWAHGLDITGPLGILFPDTDRLRHVAWLAHRSLPYAFTLAGAGAQDIACDLIAPDGTAHWRYGPEAADSVISGPAGAFCRVAAQRLRPEESGLQSSGPHGAAALRLVRTYAA